MAFWLIEQGAYSELQQRMRSALPLTAEMLEAYRRTSSESGDGPRCLTISGPVAAIEISGVLTKQRDSYYYWYDVGSTSYREIIAALALADKNPEVKSVTLNIDSPGGLVDGLFEAMAAIRAMTKPTTARCSLAASAAYGLASACKRIEAVGPGSMFGSVGVVAKYSFWDDQTIIELTNTDSPDKRPDPRTDEGKAVIRKELDAIAELFINEIAVGRSTSADDVREKFGRGAMFVAADAKRAGMIDQAPKAAKPAGARASTEDDPQPSADVEQPKPTAQRGEENVTMDLNAFKAAHPALFESIVKAAGEDAVKAERDRVGAHLAMGESSGDMKTAVKAITDGTAMTQTLMAQYMAAGMRKSAVGARQTESDETEAAVGGDDPEATTQEPDDGDRLMAYHKSKVSTVHTKKS